MGTRTIGSVLLVALSVGCNAQSYGLTPKTTMRLVGKSPEGEWQARITCTKTMEACYQRADVVCKHGYDVVSENGQASNTGAVTHCDPNLGNCYTRTTQDFDGVLFVSCKHQGNAVPKMAAH